MEQIAKMRDELVTDEELETTKKQIIETFPRTFESKPAMLGVFVGDEWTNRPKDYWKTLRDNVLEEVDRINGAYTQTLETHGVEIIHQRATVSGPHSVRLADGTEKTAERILIASECIGDAKWFIEKASAYAKERVLFGRPIGQNQGVQFPIARAWAELEAADMVCRRAAALFDNGKECGSDANIAKLLASEAAWKAADTCMQTYGGFSYAREYEIERKWREVRLYQIAPISTNLILGYVGQHVLGMPRSY